MNLKPSYRYQLYDQIKPICIYYFVVLCVYTLVFITTSFNNFQSDGVRVSGDFDGIELATAIFLFVAGMNSFKEAFGMMLQNGISRRTIFISRIMTVLSQALAMAFLDQLLTLVFKTISGITNNTLNYHSLLESVYADSVSDLSKLQLAVLSYVFAFLLYISLVSAGYLISLIFYRLNRAGKIVVGVGVPVGLFSVLPTLDYAITGGRIFAFLVKVLFFALGLSVRPHQPVNAMISFFISFLLFSGLSWLLVRRAQVRA